jgi:hypothetical protein
MILEEKEGDFKRLKSPQAKVTKSEKALVKTKENKKNEKSEVKKQNFHKVDESQKNLQKE